MPLFDLIFGRYFFMNQWQSIAPETLSDNFFTRIGKDWSLVTAGTADAFNTMTASWGGVGVLWNKNVVFTFTYI